jgi:hypothetical protein
MTRASHVDLALGLLGAAAGAAAVRVWLSPPRASAARAGAIGRNV